MKSEQQFIEGIYEKAEQIQKQSPSAFRKRRFRFTIPRLVVVSALLLVLPASIAKIGQFGQKSQEPENFSHMRTAMVQSCVVEGIVEQIISSEEGEKIQVGVQKSYGEEVGSMIEVDYRHENSEVQYFFEEGKQVLLFLEIEEKGYVLDEYGNGMCTYQGEQKGKGRVYQKADGTLLYSKELQQTY